MGPARHARQRRGVVHRSLRREVLWIAVSGEADAVAIQDAERETLFVRGARRQLDRTAGTLPIGGAGVLDSRLAKEGPADSAEHLLEQRRLGRLPRGARGGGA